jgi:hypothetical protein
MQQNDASLVEQVLAGEKVAFAPLVEHYQPEALRLARRLLGAPVERWRSGAQPTGVHPSCHDHQPRHRRWPSAHAGHPRRTRGHGVSADCDGGFQEVGVASIAAASYQQRMPSAENHCLERHYLRCGVYRHKSYALITQIKFFKIGIPKPLFSPRPPCHTSGEKSSPLAVGRPANCFPYQEVSPFSVCLSQRLLPL